ncbi:MAG: DUF72 domain-containing protein, partial [Candidatus Desulfofervidaceae bacterium]|nr:DUF72 domain-containing protein [Candidatus Desulfofervidaceae bacterium]
MMLKIGCCGFPVAQSKYFQNFNTIEIQQSFYRTLGEKQVRNWRDNAHPDFEFVLKAPQCVTHFPNSPTYRRADLPIEKREQCGGFRLNAVTEEVMEVFFARADVLKAEKFLFQTPVSFKPTEENIKAMLLFFKHFQNRGVFIWEPRGKEWLPEIVKSICQQAGLIHVVDPFLYGKPVWGDFSYFRLHGNLRTYQYSYSDTELYRLL